MFDPIVLCRRCQVVVVQLPNHESCTFELGTGEDPNRNRVDWVGLQENNLSNGGAHIVTNEKLVFFQVS
jgi:hypothetical protein